MNYGLSTELAHEEESFTRFKMLVGVGVLVGIIYIFLKVVSLVRKEVFVTWRH